WETEAGEDAEINKSTLKRLIYNLKVGEAKALDQVDASKEAIEAAEAKAAEAKAEAEKASPDEANRKIARLEKQVADLTTERDGLVKDKEISELRAEVLAGVDPKHAKHVKGETREELEASLKEIREDFGLEAPGKDDEEEAEVARTRRRSHLGNPLDPQSGKDGGEVDFDKVAAEILGDSRL